MRPRRKDSGLVALRVHREDLTRLDEMARQLFRSRSAQAFKYIIEGISRDEGVTPEDPSSSRLAHYCRCFHGPKAFLVKTFMSFEDIARLDAMIEKMDLSRSNLLTIYILGGLERDENARTG